MAVVVVHHCWLVLELVLDIQIFAVDPIQIKRKVRLVTMDPHLELVPIQILRSVRLKREVYF